MKALILGYEIAFRGPHSHASISGSSMSEMLSVLRAEGLDQGEGRLSYLFARHLESREKRISEKRLETSLDSLVELVLDDLEIESPPLVPRLVRVMSEDVMSRFSVSEGSMEFMAELRESGVRIGLVCNAPMGIPPQYIRERLEAAGLTEYLDDVQFSSENGIVRPHARPYRYAISNMNVNPADTSVLTGLPEETPILQRLGFGGVFIPEHLSPRGMPDAVPIRALSELSRYL